MVNIKKELKKGKRAYEEAQRKSDRLVVIQLNLERDHQFKGHVLPQIELATQFYTHFTDSLSKMKQSFT